VNQKQQFSSKNNTVRYNTMITTEKHVENWQSY